MSSLKKTFVVVSVLLVMYLCSGCLSDNPVSGDNDYSAEESFFEEIELAKQKRIRIEGITGTINVFGSSTETTVKVDGIRRVESNSPADAEAQLERLEVKISELTDEILIRTEQPGDTNGRNFVVNYNITMPDTLELKVFNITGAVKIESFRNEVVANNITGEIRFDQITGNVDAELITGLISGKVTLPHEGNLNLSTITGTIDVDIPTNTSAQLTASVVTGIVSLRNLTLSNIEVNTPTSVKGKLGNGDGNITVRTVTGNIAVSGF